MGLVSVLTRWVPRTVLQRGAHLVLQSVAWSYAGNTLEDPIVGKSYRKMLPYGRVRSRDNALAPHSLSLERHRAVWAYLMDSTSFFTTQGKMLHLAPEYCFLRRFKAQTSLEYITADLNSPWADHHFDCHDIPFEDNVTDPMERERLYWQQDHVRLYGHEDYPKRLKEAGFEVDVVDMKDVLGEALFMRYSLGEERWIYKVTKPAV